MGRRGPDDQQRKIPSSAEMHSTAVTKVRLTAAPVITAHHPEEE